MNKLRTLYKEHVPGSVGSITIPEYPMKCSSAQKTVDLLPQIRELEAEIERIKSSHRDYYITSGRWEGDTITIESKDTVVISKQPEPVKPEPAPAPVEPETKKKWRVTLIPEGLLSITSNRKKLSEVDFDVEDGTPLDAFIGYQNLVKYMRKQGLEMGQDYNYYIEAILHKFYPEYKIAPTDENGEYVSDGVWMNKVRDHEIHEDMTYKAVVRVYNVKTILRLYKMIKPNEFYPEEFTTLGKYESGLYEPVTNLFGGYNIHFNRFAESNMTYTGITLPEHISMKVVRAGTVPSEWIGALDSAIPIPKSLNHWDSATVYKAGGTYDFDFNGVTDILFIHDEIIK